MEESLKLFNLRPGATLHDVKKAYRVLAKKNHPDRFVDAEEKKEQETKMARINNAYQTILANLDLLSVQEQESNHVSEEPMDDYALYKKGIEYFNFYTKNVSTKVLEFELEILLDKKSILTKAKDCFQKILRTFPESDWAVDSEEKIKQLDKIIRHIENRISDIKEYSPYWTEKGTPYSKRKTV